MAIIIECHKVHTLIHTYSNTQYEKNSQKINIINFRKMLLCVSVLSRKKMVEKL